MSEVHLSKSLQSLADSLSEIKQRREKWRRFFHEHFLPFFKEWDEVTNGEVPLVSHEEGSFINHTVDEKNDIVLAFSGPNDSGKSTLINAILGKRVCRAVEGRGTFRLMMIQYADVKEGMLRSTLMNENGKLGETHEGESVPDSFQKRPEDLQVAVLNEKEKRERENRMQQLNQQWILVELNHPLLKCGLTLIDMPGLAEMQTLNRKTLKFIREKKPITLFINSDAAFKEADSKSLRQVLAAIGNSGDHITPILFVSNKFDSHLYNEDSDDESSNSEEVLNRLMWRRYQCIRSVTSNFLPELSPDKVIESNSFACISALEAYRATREGKPTNELFESFVKKLQSYICNSFDTSLRKCKLMMRASANSYWQIITYLINSSEEKVEKMAMQALRKAKQVHNELESGLKQQKEFLHEILKMIDTERVSTEAQKVITRFDGRKAGLKDELIAMVLIKDAVIQIICKEMGTRISIWINAFESHILGTLQSNLEPLIETENYLLSSSTKEAFEVDEETLILLQNSNQQKIKIRGQIISKNFWKNMAIFIGSSTVFTSLASRIKNLILHNNHKIVDESMKQEVARTIVNNVIKNSESIADEIINEVKKNMPKYSQRFENIVSRKKQLIIRIIKRRNEMEKVQNLETRFHVLESRRSCLDNIEFSLSRNEVFERDETGKIYRATWVNSKIGENEVAVKEFDEMTDRAYYEIVMRSIIGINQRGILPFYGAILKENSDIFSEKPEICIVMPLMKYTLKEVIENRMFSSLRQRLTMALDISHGLYHILVNTNAESQNLNPENIKVDNHGNAFIYTMGAMPPSARNIQRRTQRAHQNLKKSRVNLKILVIQILTNTLRFGLELKEKIDKTNTVLQIIQTLKLMEANCGQEKEKNE